MYQSPLKPPPYLDDRDEPQKEGIFADDVPLCRCCLSRSDTVKSLDQHAYAVRMSAKRKQETRGERNTVGSISLYQPLHPSSDFSPRDPLKQLNSMRPGEPCTEASKVAAISRPPAWMSLLPSNINGNVRPTTCSAMHRRLTFPCFESSRRSTPFSTPPEYPVGDTRHALALSTAVQGIPRRSRQRSEPSPSLLGHNPSSPPSYAIAGRQHRRHLPLDRNPPLPNYWILSPSLHETHEPNVALLSEHEMTGLQQTRKRRAPSISPPCPNERRSSARNESSVHFDPTCVNHHHIPVANQPIALRKPPFYKELSTFFTTRAGRWILPSRVSESKDGHEEHSSRLSCS